MPKWKDEQKSVYNELGWGSSKEGGDKKRKTPHYTDGKSKYKCPVCENTKSNDIIDRRADYLECRGCGYVADIDEWDLS